MNKRVGEGKERSGRNLDSRDLIFSFFLKPPDSIARNSRTILEERERETHTSGEIAFSPLTPSSPNRLGNVHGVQKRLNDRVNGVERFTFLRVIVKFRETRNAAVERSFRCRGEYNNLDLCRSLLRYIRVRVLILIIFRLACSRQSSSYTFTDI